MSTRRNFLQGAATLGTVLAANPALAFWGATKVPTPEEYVARQGPKFLEKVLFPWIRIETTSDSDAGNPEGCKLGAEFLRDELTGSGFSARTIDLPDGNPLVFAERIVDPSLPTVLLYGHYDVQLADPAQWVLGGKQLKPFEPTVIDGRVYARGAIDNKGPIGTHLLAARYFDQHGSPCNVKFLVEGDEERGGSPSSKFVTEHADLLASDLLIVSDTKTLRGGHPCLTTSLKGIVIGTATAEDPKDLIELIHNAHDPQENRVLLPGFYDRVVDQRIPKRVLDEFGAPEEGMGDILRPETGYAQLEHRWYRPTISPLSFIYANQKPSNTENKKTVRITAHGPNIIEHSGVYGGPVQEPALYLSHLLTGLKEEGIEYDLDFIHYGTGKVQTKIRPTGDAQITIDESVNIDDVITRVARKYNLARELLEVNNVGERRAYLGEERFGESSYTPTAILSFRIVGNQDPQEVLSSLDTLAEITSKDITVEPVHAGPAFKTSIDNPYIQAVSAGLQKGYGTDGVHTMGVGGSIPIIEAFHQTLGIPIALAGFASPDANYHGSLENMRKIDFYNGTQSMIHALKNVGQLQR
jgi:acetylornithine deacetylase/succinyl-diaminopimelate desuccinylase-like protein